MIRNGKPSTKLMIEWDQQRDAEAYRIMVTLVAIDAFGGESPPTDPQIILVNRAGMVIPSAPSRMMELES